MFSFVCHCQLFCSGSLDESIFYQHRGTENENTRVIGGGGCNFAAAAA